jgi:DNA-binding phage protein
MVTIEIHPFDAANYLTEAENLTKLAKATGTNRQALYTALSENGNPALETLLKVLAALGTRLKCEVGAANGSWWGDMTSGGAM